MKTVTPFVILLASFRCAAQSPAAQPSAPSAAFEVASIKPHKDMRPMNAINLSFLQRVGQNARNGRFNMKGVPLSVLIELAYNVKEYQAVGWPSWANSDGYDVDAKAEGDATFEQMRPMLRSLLADRFKLALHREVRDLPIYELTSAKSGLRIVASKEGSCNTPDPNKLPPPGANGGPPLNICGTMRQKRIAGDHIEGNGILMRELIGILSDEVGRTVTDKTGFKETFNFRLDFAPDVLANGNTGAEAGTSIFTALQDQLGMRLESAKGPVEVLIIDHAERPSEN